MDAKERLAELLRVDLSGSEGDPAEEIAEYLLSKGVSVAENDAQREISKLQLENSELKTRISELEQKIFELALFVDGSTSSLRTKLPEEEYKALRSKHYATQKWIEKNGMHDAYYEFLYQNLIKNGGKYV